MPAATTVLRRAALCLLSLALAACALPRGNDALSIYEGAATPQRRLTVADFEGQVEMTGSSATVPKPANPRVPESQVGARRTAGAGEGGVEGNALTLHWKNAWYASLRVEAAAPLDLRPYLAGTLEFDLKVVDMAQGGLSFRLACGTDCERKLNYLLPARAEAGKGWRHVSLRVACFAREGDDFSAVKLPFALDASGSGEVAVARVRFVRRGEPNTSCPDYRTESVTPGILAQSWAMSWWLPRHEQRLAEIQRRRQAGEKTEIVFVGDSITEGWERAGQPVWNQHYLKYNPLLLGFGGDHTENLLWRLQHGEIDGIAPRVVVMMIGTNNTGDRQEDPKTTAAGVQRNIDEIRRRLPEARILLLAIFPRDEKPSGALRKINERVNALIAAQADGRKVFFLNINEFLMNPDGTLSKDILPDWLHLSERGYALWARSMEPTLQRLLALP